MHSCSMHVSKFKCKNVPCGISNVSFLMHSRVPKDTQDDAPLDDGMIFLSVFNLSRLSHNRGKDLDIVLQRQ